MPKIKTNRAAAKRFKKTGTGKLNKKIDKEKKKSQTVDNYRCNKRKEHEEGITISVRRSLIVRMRCCRTIQ